MAFSIKSPEADALARRLVAETHETLTEAVTVALRERLDRQLAARRSAAESIARVTAEYTALTVTDTRTTDDLIGYDADGVPA